MSPPDRTLVVFADEDEEFARGYLAPALGGSGDGPSKVQLLSGAALRALPVVELERLLDEHRAILLVLTPAFLSDPWVRVSEQLASAKAIPGETRVIPLRLIDCEVPLRLEAKTGLDFFEEEGEARWELWAELVERLRRDLALPPPPAREVRCPYPGLRPYTGDEGAYYFGRAAEIDETVERLGAGARELFLVGPSGCGKSSLLYAGVVPRLLARAAAEDRRLFVRQLRPGATPVAALYRALAGSGAKAAPSASSVEAAAEALLRSSPQGELLVVIDQLEEVFTQADVGAQRELAAALKELREKPQVSLLLALRADFFADLLQSELWQESKKAQVSVAPLRKAALREAIEGPARACGVYLESGLTEVLLADAAEEPGALPLLQETLLKLWQHRRERLVPLSAYRAMSQGGKSGMATALAQHADRAFAELDAPRQKVAKRAMLRLVTFGDGRPHTRRRQRRRELRSGAATPGQPARDDLTPVLDALARARLLTIDSGEAQDDPEDDAVDLCHDALVAGWPQLAAWIGARKADEVQRRRLEVAAKEWVDAGRGESGLFDSKRYAAAAAWMDSEGACEAGWSGDVTALMAASKRALEQRARRTRRRLTIFFSTIGATAVVAVILAAWAFVERAGARRSEQRAVSNEQRAVENARRADAQRRRADELRIEQFLRAADVHLEANEPQRAIPLLVAARELGHDSVALRGAFRRATRVVQLASLRPFDESVATLTSAGDRILIVGGGDRALLWERRSRSIVAELVHRGKVTSAVISPDGRRAVTTEEDVEFEGSGSVLRLWDLEAKPPQMLSLAEGAVGSSTVLFSEDSTTLLARYGRGLRLFSAATGSAISAPFGDGPINDVLFSSRRVVAQQGNCIVSWRLEPLAEERRLCSNQTKAKIAFARQGDLVAMVTYQSAEIAVWDPETGAVSRLLAGASADLRADFAVVHRGEWILTSDATGMQTWDLRVLEKPIRRIEYGCRGGVLDVDEVGDRALVACEGKPELLMDLKVGAVLGALYAPTGIVQGELSSDGQLALTWEEDGTMRVWDVSEAPGPRAISLGMGLLEALSPDASWFAVARQGVLRLLPTAGGAEVALQWPQGRSESVIAEFSPDGQLLAAVSQRRALYVWDVSSARLVIHRGGARRLQRPALTWSPDSRSLATVAPFDESANAERIDLWKVGDAQVRTLPQGLADDVEGMALLDDELLIAGRTGVVQRWSLRGPTMETVVDARHGKASADWRAVALSRDGRWLAAAVMGIVEVWSLGKSPTLRYATKSSVGALFLCHEGACLVTQEPISRLTAARRLHLWDLRSGVELAGPEVANDALVAVDDSFGERIVTAREARAHVRVARDGSPLTNALVHPAPILTAKMSEDGRWLLLWSSGGVATLWDIGVDSSGLEAWRAIDRSNVVPPEGQETARPALTTPAASIAPNPSATPGPPAVESSAP